MSRTKLIALLAAVLMIAGLSSVVYAGSTSANYPDFTLDVDAATKTHFNDIWDLTKADLVLEYTIDMSGIQQPVYIDWTCTPWIEIGMREVGSPDFNPGAWKTHPGGKGGWVTHAVDNLASDPNNLDIDDHLILSNSGGRGSDWDYDVLASDPDTILASFGSQNNSGFWYDRTGVDPYQATWMNPGAFNTGGIYHVKVIYHAVDESNGTMILTVNGVPQSFIGGTMPGQQAGLSFAGDMTKMQVFAGAEDAAVPANAGGSVTIRDMTVSANLILDVDEQTRMHFDDVWDLTESPLVLSYHIDLSHISMPGYQDWTYTPWIELGLREVGAADFNPGLWATHSGGKGGWVIQSLNDIYDQDPAGGNFDIDDFLGLSNSGGRESTLDYDILAANPIAILAPFGTQNNSGFWYDRDGVDQWQAQTALPGQYNTDGQYDVAVTYRAVDDFTGTMILTVNGVPQTFITGTQIGNQAGLSFTGDMRKMQVFAGAEDAAVPANATGYAAVSNISVVGQPATAELRISEATGKDVVYVKQGTPVYLVLEQDSTFPVNGFQAFLAYDSAFLGSVSATLTTSPYSDMPYSTLGTGTIDLANGVYSGAAASGAQLIANLQFTAGAGNGETYVTFRDNDAGSRLTDADGNDIPTALVNGPKIVVDNTIPTITAPADITQNTDPGQAYATVDLGIPAVNDNCPGVTYVNDAPATFPVGPTTVTWVATDLAGNPATATQIVTVVDAELPTITAPADITQNTDPGQAYATVNLGTPTVADNCPGVTYSNDAPATFPVGTTNVIWTAEDASGNKATATQSVTINDEEKPTITAPANFTVNADAGECYATDLVLGTPVCKDNCGVGPVVSDAPAEFEVGNTTVTWTVTDINGNISSATQIVTVDNKWNAEIQLSLADVTVPSVDRKIKIQYAPNKSLYATVNFQNGSGVAAVEIPFECGDVVSTITAKDEQHTLAAKGSLAVAGKEFVSDGVISLLGGDLTNDNLIDIRDFGVFAGQFNSSPALTTTWPTRNANINCSGDPGVGTDDFIILSGRFLTKGETFVTTIQSVPMASMSVRDLARIAGRDAAIAADLDGNQTVNQTDVQLFVKRYMAPKRGR